MPTLKKRRSALLNCVAYAVGGLAITTATTSVPVRAKTVSIVSTPMDLDARAATSVSARAKTVPMFSAPIVASPVAAASVPEILVPPVAKPKLTQVAASTSIGPASTCTGAGEEACVAVGVASTGSGKNSTAVGIKNTAGGENSVAIGNVNNALNTDSAAIG